MSFLVSCSLYGFILKRFLKTHTHTPDSGLWDRETTSNSICGLSCVTMNHLFLCNSSWALLSTETLVSLNCRNNRQILFGHWGLMSNRLPKLHCRVTSDFFFLKLQKAIINDAPFWAWLRINYSFPAAVIRSLETYSFTNDVPHFLTDLLNGEIEPRRSSF